MESLAKNDSFSIFVHFSELWGLPFRGCRGPRQIPWIVRVSYVATVAQKTKFRSLPIIPRQATCGSREAMAAIVLPSYVPTMPRATFAHAGAQLDQTLTEWSATKSFVISRDCKTPPFGKPRFCTQNL
eukprot:2894790-Amphidinium_carterae.1